LLPSENQQPSAVKRKTNQTGGKFIEAQYEKLMKEKGRSEKGVKSLPEQNAGGEDLGGVKDVLETIM